jgi:hypothetical protein
MTLQYSKVAKSSVPVAVHRTLKKNIVLQQNQFYPTCTRVQTVQGFLAIIRTHILRHNNKLLSFWIIRKKILNL